MNTEVRRGTVDPAAAGQHDGARETTTSNAVFIGMWSTRPAEPARNGDGPVRAQTATIVFLSEGELPARLIERLRRERAAMDVGSADNVGPLADVARPTAVFESADCDHVVFDQLEIDVAQRRVRWAGRALELSGHELELLALLAGRAGGAVGFAELFARVWGADHRVDPLVAHSAVRRLRRKLAAAGAGAWIESVRGYGFRLVRRRHERGGAGSQDSRATGCRDGLPARPRFDEAMPIRRH